MPSTKPFGAGWRMPSSGRTSRRTGAHRGWREPRHRRRHQHEPVDPVGVPHPHLERHPAAHAVAEQVHAVELERVEQRLDPAGEHRRVVGGAGNGLSESPKPGRSIAIVRKPGASAGDCRQELGLGGAEAVEHHDRLAFAAGLESRHAPAARSPGAELEPGGVVARVGGGQEADAEVEVAADGAACRRGRPASRRAGR